MASGRAPVQGGRFSAAADPLARAVFALLVVACFAAFFITQRLKHTPTPVQKFERTPTFSPSAPDPEDRQERLSFKLAQADEVTVTVINSGGATVATVLRQQPVPRYKQFSFRWNGRTGAPRGYEELNLPPGHRSLLALNTGRFAPPGEYRVRVDLLKQHKEVLSPWSFTLEAR